MGRWAEHIERFRWFWIIGWPILAALCWIGAPRFSTLLHDDAHGFIPADMPAQRAQALLKTEFPEHAPASRAAILFHRLEGLTEQDRTFIARVAHALHEKQEAFQWRVRAAALTPFLRRFFESADGQAALIAVDMPAEMLTHSTVNRVREVRRILESVPLPEGVVTELTGNAALGELIDSNAKRDVDMTTLWTFAAVVFILMWIYRSPVAMLLPMISLTVALMIALGIIGRAVACGLPVNGLLEMFVIVLVVGTGVDYCLFLFARFREELPDPHDGRRAAQSALHRTGRAILGSTATNAAGLATLILARHRDLHTSGPTIAFALCIGALVVLTFTPALMSVVGRALLWPQGLHSGRHDDGRWWWHVGRLVTERPWVVTAAILGLLVIPALLGTRVRPSYDALGDFPADSSFVRGAHLFTRHFHHTEDITEFTMLLDTASPMNDATLAQAQQCLGAAADRVQSVFPLAYVRHLGDPLGDGDAEALDLFGLMARRMARDYYLGASGRVLRVDAALKAHGRTDAGMNLVDKLARTFHAELTQCADTAAGWTIANIQVSGEAPLYRDIRALRARDFRVVAVAACVVIFLILFAITRSTATSVVLLAATLLTYLATYGTTWLIFTRLWGTESISHQLPFLLFIILMSLGQDYNIYVVTRIAEHRRHADPVQAIRIAVEKTGRVVSSCGIIMAATFGSMLSGSLLLMKQFGVALALGILLDTFVIRPLFVPALLTLLHARMRRAEEDSMDTAPTPCTGAAP